MTRSRKRDGRDKVVPLRKGVFYRPSYGKPFAAFGYDPEDQVVIVRHPDGRIERTPVNEIKSETVAAVFDLINQGGKEAQISGRRRGKP